MGASTEDLTREERRDAYERVLSIVDHNTGGKQRAMVARTSVTQIAVSIGIVDPAKRVRAAIENDDLLRYHGRVCRTDEESLRAVILQEADAKHTRKTLVGRCNRALEEVDDGE